MKTTRSTRHLVRNKNRTNLIFDVALSFVLIAGLVACGHTSGAGSSEGGGLTAIGRNPDGVPLLPDETYVSTFKGVARPLRLSDVSTWTIKEQYGLGLYGDIVDVDGVKAIATSFACSIATPEAKEGCLFQQQQRRVDSIVERLSRATGKDVSPKAADALPPAKDSQSGEKLTWLTVCDAACVAKAAQLGGVNVTLDELEKSINAKLQAEHDKKVRVEFEKKRVAVFADTKPDRWVGDSPWWTRFSSRLVPYVDGSTVLVGVGKLDKNEGITGPKALQTAGNRARGELAKAIQVVVKREAVAKGIEISTESKLDLVGTTIPGMYEDSNAAWALAVCDQTCLTQTLADAKIDLAPVAFKPGAIE